MTRQQELLDRLRRYRAADRLESEHVAEFIELLATPADAFSRAHFTPGHVTAGCFIFDEERGALLLHHHRRLGRWLQMGGHVEGEEGPLDAALREASEESGLRDLALLVDDIFDIDVHRIPAGRGEPEHRHFDVRYVARTASPDAVTIDPAESNGIAWVPLDAALALMNEEASARVIRKIRSRL